MILANLVLGALAFVSSAPVLQARPAQDRTRKPDLHARIYSALRTIRNPKTSEGRREDLVRELLSLGVDAAIPLYNQSREELKKCDREWQRARRKYLTLFEQRAFKLVRARLTKRVQIEIDAIQKEHIALSRQRSLTKQLVLERADALQSRLRELLETNTDSVHDADEAVAHRAHALDSMLAELLRLREDLDRARQVLESEPRGKRHLARQPELPLPLPYRARLERERTLLCILATPMREQDRRTLRENFEQSKKLDPSVSEAILHHNRIRVRTGLGALAIDLKLCTASREHSKDMVEHDFFSHRSPLPGKTRVGDRARLAGTTGGGENIAAGQRTGLGAIRAWWYSPGHHRNLMGGYSRVGLGHHGTKWTQMFGG